MARYDLKLTDEQFYELTPRQLDALVKRREYDAEKQEYLFARLTACVVNYSIRHPEEWITVDELMPPGFVQNKPKKRYRKPTKKQLRQAADQIRQIAKFYDQ